MARLEIAIGEPLSDRSRLSEIAISFARILFGPCELLEVLCSFLKNGRLALILSGVATGVTCVDAVWAPDNDPPARSELPRMNRPKAPRRERRIEAIRRAERM